MVYVILSFPAQLSKNHPANKKNNNLMVPEDSLQGSTALA